MSHRVLVKSKAKSTSLTEIDKFLESSRAKLRTDPKRALALAESAIASSQKLAEPVSLGRSYRAKANALHMLGENRGAIEFHEQALRLFHTNRDTLEIARTENASIQPLILLGEYSRALRSAKLAKRLFDKWGDKLRIAYVEINHGNIYHRQDRFEEALSFYTRAYRGFVALREVEGIAVASTNISSCLVCLNDFKRALDAYDQSRKLCARYGMTLLVTQTDYNRAYLHYLRGDYGRAIDVLRAVRDQASEAGDAHVFALSHLLLSEIYVELNLGKEAIETAQLAAVRFRELGMGYETAKALVNEAIVLGQHNRAKDALRIFEEARTIFAQEGNLAWPSLIDLYRAFVLSAQSSFEEAKQLCTETLPRLEQSGQIAKAVLCRLLLGRLHLGSGHPAEASAEAAAALGSLSRLQLPILNFQAHFLEGKIHLRQEDPHSAYKSLERARQDLEGLRTTLQKDELKIAFIKDKEEIYEVLVDLCLKKAHPKATPAKMFEFMELAKSRGLMELMLRDARPNSTVDQKRAATSELRDIRDQIHWHYRRIELEQLRPTAGNPDYAKQLKKEASQLEEKYLKKFRDQPGTPGKNNAHGPVKTVSLENVQANLSPNTSILEYFSVGEIILATVIDRNEICTVPVSTKTHLRRLVQGLHLQLSKFRLGGDYLREFGDVLRESVEGHLKELYADLVAPVSPLLGSGHLVVIPHGILHGLPFHALHDGAAHIIERRTLSYAPSASIYSLGSKAASTKLDSSLILGIPDSAAPLIRDEVNAISKILPNAEIYLGKRATEKVLREKSANRQLIHIATHGNFRQDNPTFSTIKLGGSYLNLCDLYEMDLHTDLVTLSGCGTGLNFVSAGDEHVGLMRGFLSAGARSLLLTLWDVNDRSTADFMTSFYQSLRNGYSKAQSHRLATLHVKQRYPHPYYWASFTLVGNAS